MIKTEESVAWLKENYLNHQNLEGLARAFNDRFCTSAKASYLKDILNDMGLRISDRYRYSNEELDFLRNNAWNMNSYELTEALNKALGKNRSRHSVLQKCCSLGLTVLGDYDNRLRFTRERWDDSVEKKGTIRRRNEGDITVCARGTEYIFHNNELVPRSRYEYEISYGKKPDEDKIVLFLDGDNRNYSKDNMTLVSRGVNARMNKNHNGCSGRPKELNKAYVTAYQIDEIISKEKKK